MNALSVNKFKPALIENKRQSYNKHMGQIISVDLGGTQIRVAAFHRNSFEPITIKKVPTKGPDPVIERMADTIRACWPENNDVERIIVALPGAVDSRKGILFTAVNLPEWQNYPVKAELERRFSVETRIGNDANLAALGEWKFGAGKGYDDLIYITVSTGIGGGIISNGQLLVGSHGLAGEIGHITIDLNGPKCSCGQYGHLEAIASGTAITNYVKEHLSLGVKSNLSSGPHLDTKMIASAAQNGDKLAIGAIDRATNALGKGIASLAHLFNPAIVIIGGGVSLIGDPFILPIRRIVKESVMDAIYLKDLFITRSTLGDNAGLMGALALGHLPPDG